MKINIWTLILDNFHQWNFFQTILQIFFLKSIFQQQRNNLLIDYLILDPILFHSSKTKRNKKIKKKRRKKKKEGIKIIHRLIKTEIQEENTNWSDEIKKMHHGLAPVRCNADEAIRILFPPETTLHFPFSSTFSSTFSFSSSLSSEQQNWTWFRHTSEKPATAVFIFSRTLEPEV